MSKPYGGSFLLESHDVIFTPEDFTAEHKAVAKTTDEFWTKEVAPNVEEVQKQNFPVLISVLRKSAELGLLGVLVPEQFGGMEMGLISAMIVAQGVARDGSYATCHGAQAGIGSLPILLFGTDAQKTKYLRRLVSAEMVAAYALTEPQAGSDAMAIRTRADLASDGSHYLLNGQKMWITNGGIADFFTVFAKVDGDKFSAFLVERSWPGVSAGVEEKKMGLKGSSTTAVYFDNVRVPVENVLGEVGRGHIIAFNILNLGRLKLGMLAQGGALEVLATSIRYSRDRKAFAKSLAEFGLIQHKLAEMAVRMFVNETMAYRVAGAIESRLEEFSWTQPDAARTMLKAVEEFAAECSFVKIFGSEMLDFVVDEAVQIHGGYGFHQDYSVERAYRDARVNRIFEGTNEINRLLATGMLLKRAQKGLLPLPAAVKKLESEIEAGAQFAEMDVSSNAKRLCLFLLGAAFRKFGGAIDEQQEVTAALTDALMYTYAVESVSLRAAKAPSAQDMVTVFTASAVEMLERCSRTILAACYEGDVLRKNLDIARGFLSNLPPDITVIRRRIAQRLVDRGRYVV